MLRSNKRPRRFIVIEGIDGVGKTTIATQLCESLGYKYYKTPPAIIESFNSPLNESCQSLRGFVDKLAYISPQARYLFYLFGLVVASKEIEEILCNYHVVCDRYMASTLAYHWALDPQLENANVNWVSVVRPDFEFLLTIYDEKEHKRRLRERGNPQSDLLLEQNQTFLLQVQERFKKMGLIEIDVSNISINSVVEIITQTLLGNENEQ